MPQTFSIVFNSRPAFCMMETLKPKLRTKTSRVQSVDIKWSTRDCWAVSESRHGATVHQECMTACVKAWKLQILNQIYLLLNVCAVLNALNGRFWQFWKYTHSPFWQVLDEKIISCLCMELEPEGDSYSAWPLFLKKEVPLLFTSLLCKD